MSIAGGPDIVENGLVLHLDAADLNSYPGSGTLWTDLTGNGNNGTLTNGPTFSSSNKGGIVLDGTNDYISCGSGTSINISGDFSICAWAYLDITPTATMVILEKGAYGSTDEYGMILSSTAANGVSFQCNNSFFYSSQPFPVSKWTYAVGTLSGTSGTYYENNKSVKTGTLTAPTSGSSTLFLGYRTGVGFYYDGSMSQIAIYNRALSATEILQNYNATKGRYGL